MSTRLSKALLGLMAFLLLLPVTAQLQEASFGRDTIRVFAIDGAIGPATSDYLVGKLAEASADGVYMAVITMDTPGGLDLAMRDIIQAILESNIPVTTYVSPRGARAASAGTYILYASHIAAMAPATNLGSATPVQIGMPSVPGVNPAEEGGEQEAAPGEDSGGSAMERKMINDAMAYIRGLADMHGRNGNWAENAVMEAANLPSSEALAMNVIDLVAEDLDDLLAQADGMTVMVDGAAFVIDTAGKRVVMDEPDWRIEFLKVITNPNLILILGMLGVYGLIIEFYNPGFGFAGITGGICLMLAAYGLQLLPINYVGLGLIIFGLILILSEAFIPSFGILGVGGIIAFSIGAIILVDAPMGIYRVSLPLVAGVGVAIAALLIFTLRLFMKVRQQPPVSGMETWVGMTGVSVDSFDHDGMVRLEGELWHAVTDTPLQSGDNVRIKKVNGLALEVTKA